MFHRLVSTFNLWQLCILAGHTSVRSNVENSKQFSHNAINISVVIFVFRLKRLPLQTSAFSLFFFFLFINSVCCNFFFSIWHTNINHSDCWKLYLLCRLNRYSGIHIMIKAWKVKKKINFLFQCAPHGICNVY